MKRVLGILVILLISSIGIGVVSSQAEETEYAPETYFEYVNGTITKYMGQGSVVNIPPTLGGVSVKVIADRAFEHCTFSSVKIPDSVTSIGSYAFASCSNLTTVEIGGGVTSIGSYAFEECNRLKNIEMPDSLKSIRSYAFYHCDNLTNVSFGDGVTSIGICAFCACDSLKNIEIPDSVTSIGSNAFSGCDNLMSVKIGDSVTSIGDWAFDGCDKLESLELGNSVKSIGIHAFENCDSLKDIEIPDSATSIGDWAFSLCDNLMSVKICHGAISIGEYAFYCCSNLTSVELGDSVTTIGGWAFEGCRSLKNIEIPDSLTSIGNGVFASCDDLIDVKIGTGVTSIGNGAFSDCVNITEIIIPEKVKVINSAMFYNCSLLDTIYLPESLTKIDSSAFYNCYWLTDVYYSGTKEGWESISIKTTGNEYLGFATIHYGVEIPNIYSFITNGGSTVASITGEIDEEPLTTKEGFDFIGWYDSEALTGEKIAFPYSGEATTLYARWWPIGEEIRNLDYIINSITLRDVSTNNVIEAIPNTSFIAEINVTNVSSEKVDIIIITSYDECETLLDMDFVYADLEIGEDITFGSLISNSNGEVHFVKAFVRPRINSLVPLAESIEISK